MNPWWHKMSSRVLSVTKKKKKKQCHFKWWIKSNSQINDSQLETNCPLLASFIKKILSSYKCRWRSLVKSFSFTLTTAIKKKSMTRKNLQIKLLKNIICRMHIIPPPHSKKFLIFPLMKIFTYNILFKGLEIVYHKIFWTIKKTLLFLKKLILFHILFFFMFLLLSWILLIKFDDFK